VSRVFRIKNDTRRDELEGPYGGNGGKGTAEKIKAAGGGYQRRH
jgi:hypothetical protein